MRPTFFYAISLLCFSFCLQLTAQENRFTKVFYDLAGEGISANRSVLTVDEGILTVGGNLLLKVDSLGSKVWSKSYYSAQSRIEFADVIALSDTSYVTVGTLSHLVTNVPTGLIQKVNAVGEIVWSKTLQLGTVPCKIASVEKTFDQNLVVVGFTAENNSLRSRMVVAKMTSDGDLLWSKLYTGSNTENCAYSIKQKADSSFVITGELENCNPCTTYAFLLQVSESGQPIWAKKYINTKTNYGRGLDMSIEPDHIVFLVQEGILQVDGLGTIKRVTSSRALTFQVAGQKNGYRRRLLKTKDGGYLIPCGNPFGAALVKTDSDCNIAWLQRLLLVAADVHETQSGQLVVVGNGPMQGVGVPENILSPQIGIIRTDHKGNGSGCTDLETLFPYEDSIQASAQVFNVQAVGSLQPISIQTDSIKIIEINDCVGFQSKRVELQNDHLLSVAPNPTHSKITIQSEPKIDKAMVAIYDLNGRKIRQMDEDQYSGEIDLSGLHTGVYLLRITTDAQVGTVKIVKE